jgi:hypothetical protein
VVPAGACPQLLQQQVLAWQQQQQGWNLLLVLLLRLLQLSACLQLLQKALAHQLQLHPLA